MKKITNEEINILIRYLSSKPYIEVFKLLQLLSGLPEVKEENDRQNTKKN